MKALISRSLAATALLTAALAVGCASREVKTETTYVPETPNVGVQPAPVVVTPPAETTSVEPSSTSTSQTTTVYKSDSTDNQTYPGGQDSVVTSRTHSESNTVRTVPPPPSTTTTTIVTTPASE